MLFLAPAAAANISAATRRAGLRRTCSTISAASTTTIIRVEADEVSYPLARHPALPAGASAAVGRSVGRRRARRVERVVRKTVRARSAQPRQGLSAGHSLGGRPVRLFSRTMRWAKSLAAQLFERAQSRRRGDLARAAPGRFQTVFQLGATAHSRTGEPEIVRRHRHRRDGHKAFRRRR